MTLSLDRRRVVLGIAGLSLQPSSTAKADAEPSRIVFLSSPLADYLHLLLFRAAKPRFPAFSPEGFANLPKLDRLVSVPETVAAAGLRRYEEVEPFVAETYAALPAMRVATPHPLILSYADDPPTLDAVLTVIRAGAPWFDAFDRYWREYIAGPVDAQISAWREQEQRNRLLRRLLEMHRLPLRAPNLTVAAMPFHPAGSANYSPAAVYTSLFRTPDLGRVMGHEVSHLLWSAAVGTDWKAHPLAQEASSLAERASVDIEETMCLLMQTVLSQAGGVQPPDYRISSDLPNGSQRRLMTALEAGWENYLASADRWPTLIDYVVEAALKVLA